MLQMSSAHGPFDSRIFHKECRGLNTAGVDVGLLVVHPRDEIVDGVQIVGLPKQKTRFRRMLITPVQLLVRALRYRADIYHFHDPELIGVGLILAALGRTVVYDVHEDLPLSVLAKPYLPRWSRKPLSLATERIHRLVERVFDGTVVVTPGVGDRFYAPTLVRNYPVLSEFPPSETSYEQRPRQSVYIGVVAEIRGFDNMVRAAEILSNRTEHRLALAGTLRSPAAERYLANSSEDGPVSYHGVLDRQGVADLLAESRVGLVTLPAENVAYETAYPIKLFEYMAAGIPVVASDFPVYRELVEEAQCGLLVDPSDPIAIAKAIEWLLDHEAEAEAMGQSGRQAVLERLNWSSELDNLLSLYTEIVSV